MALNIFQFIKNDDLIIANEMCFSTEHSFVYRRQKHLIDFNFRRFLRFTGKTKLQKGSKHVK